MSNQTSCLFLKSEDEILIYDLQRLKIDDSFCTEESKVINFCYLRYAREVWILCEKGLVIVVKISKDHKSFLKNLSFQFNIESSCEFYAIAVEDTEENSYVALAGMDLEEKENVVELFRAERNSEEEVNIEHLDQKVIDFKDKSRQGVLKLLSARTKSYLRDLRRLSQLQARSPDRKFDKVWDKSICN